MSEEVAHEDLSSIDSGRIQEAETELPLEKLRQATNLRDILALGVELLRSSTDYMHPIILRNIADALNRAGQSELAAQYLLKSEEVLSSHQQIEVNAALANRLNEITNLGAELSIQLNRLTVLLQEKSNI